MKRRTVLLFASGLVLAGCTNSRRYGLELPLLSVQALSVADTGDSLTLLVRHFGKRPVRVTGLQLDVLLLGETLTLQQNLDLPLPPQAQESLVVALTMPASLRADLLSLSGDRGTELSIRGTLSFGMGQREVQFDGRIAPVPGRPGQFR